MIFLKFQPKYPHFFVGCRAVPTQKKTKKKLFLLLYLCCSYHRVSAVVISRLHEARREAGDKTDVVRWGQRLKRFANNTIDEDNCPHVNSLNNNKIPT